MYIEVPEYSLLGKNMAIQVFQTKLSSIFQCQMAILFCLYMSKGGKLAVIAEM